jgi:hypothetical protein
MFSILISIRVLEPSPYSRRRVSVRIIGKRIIIIIIILLFTRFSILHALFTDIISFSILLWRGHAVAQ